MMKFFLKFLGLIYEYTGLYLGKPFENRYIKKNMKKFRRRYLKSAWKKEGLDFDQYLGIEIGMWQCNHGFYRRMKF